AHEQAAWPDSVLKATTWLPDPRSPSRANVIVPASAEGRRRIRRMMPLILMKSCMGFSLCFGLKNRARGLADDVLNVIDAEPRNPVQRHAAVAAFGHVKNDQQSVLGRIECLLAAAQVGVNAQAGSHLARFARGALRERQAEDLAGRVANQGG